MTRVLPSITTLPTSLGTWHSKAAEVEKLELTTVALFLTGLKSNERAECLDTLVTKHLTIPFVHARSDMRIAEYDRLIAEFGTERFNLHPLREYPLIEELPQCLRDKIYIENTVALHREDIEGFAGICLDTSHLEDFRLQKPEIYTEVAALLEEFPIGANHMSAVMKDQAWDGEQTCYSNHEMKSLEQYDYLKAYPRHYFADFAAIELYNSLEDQLRAKKYIEEIIASKN